MHLNFSQRVVMAFGALAITVMALFPPWLVIFQIENRRIGERFIGYHPIWQSNQATDSGALTELFSTPIPFDDLVYFSTRLDTTRLVVQIAATLIITLLLLALVGNRKINEPKKSLLDNLD